MIPTKNLIGAAIAVAAFSLAGCASSTTTETAARTAPTKRLAQAVPGQSGDFWAWWNQPVVYFRNANAYFSPPDRMYYWYHSGTWDHGKELPRWVTPERSGAKFVKRGRLLSASGNAPTVIAFNPHYVPYEPADEAAQQFADGSAWPTDENGVITFMAPVPADEADTLADDEVWDFLDTFDSFTDSDGETVTLVEED